MRVFLILTAALCVSSCTVDPYPPPVASTYAYGCCYSYYDYPPYYTPAPAFEFGIYNRGYRHHGYHGDRHHGGHRHRR